ncbi:MAG TPA: GNAT family N-acetyltransferase, partial [Nocardioides sp.]|nr:GNAT family N-acetyltransferase [Nocardioides sp.]
MSAPAPGVEVRELDTSDDAALDAWHHVYAVAETHELGSAATAWQLEEVRAMMQRGGTQAWLGGWTAVVDGTPVGAGWMRTPLLDNLELAEVAVHVLPEHRRRGIGSALLDRLEDVARQRGRRILTGLASWAWDAGSEGVGGSGPGFA